MFYQYNEELILKGFDMIKIQEANFFVSSADFKVPDLQDQETATNPQTKKKLFRAQSKEEEPYFNLFLKLEHSFNPYVKKNL